MPESSHFFNEARDILDRYLEAEGLRKTPERYLILGTVYEQTAHFDAETLHSLMKAAGHRVSKATIYNCLELLLSCDLITKHRFSEDGTALYEKAHGFRQHDHLICTECKRVLEFCDPRIQQIKESAGEFLGFDVIHHSLLLYGRCTAKNCTYNKSLSCA